MEGINKENVSDIKYHDDLLIPVGSETVAASRYEPVDYDSPLPVILMVIPYRKDDHITFGAYDPTLQYLARHGYEVVAVDLIGIGGSSGPKTTFMGGEGKQLVKVIEWLADQEWTTGEVGMFGKSYGGLTTLQAAAEQPEALKAIVPVAISWSPYEINYPRGAFNLLLMSMWYTYMPASRALPPSRRDSDGRWKDIWMEHLDDLRDNEPWMFQVMDHDTYDEFWEKREIDVENIDVPTLATCGYRDLNTLATVDYFERIGGPKRLILGPERHTIPHRSRESPIDFRRQMVEWFDYYIKGINNSAPDHPTISYWTERDGGWKIGGGTWRGTDAWPKTDDQSTLSYAFSPEGLIPTDSFIDGSIEEHYEYNHTVGINSMEKIKSFTTTGPETALDDANSVVFETQPFSNAVELTGNGRLIVRLSATTQNPVLSVRVNDVCPDGTSKPVTSGYIQAGHRNADPATDGKKHTTVNPLTPNEEYDITIPLSPKSHLFEEGHTMRVAVSAANFPRALPSADHGSFTISSSPEAPSLLEFPGVVHGEGIVFDDEIEMNPPDDSLIPTSSEYIVDGASDCKIVHSLGDNSSAIIATSSKITDLPHGARMIWSHDVEASVKATDPKSAYIQNDVDISLDYGFECVKVIASSRMSHDAATLRVKASVDEQLIFDEMWRK